MSPTCPAHLLSLDPASQISQNNSPYPLHPYVVPCHTSLPLLHSPQKHPIIIHQAGHNLHPKLNVSHSSQQYHLYADPNFPLPVTL
jgi:hypothetical protein